MRKILEDEIEAQLEGTYDVLANGSISSTGGGALTEREAGIRAAIVAAIERKRAAGMRPDEAVADYLRDAAFTVLNRFVALKMLEARGLVQECVSRGMESSGYGEFAGMAPGVLLLPDGHGYRLYLESLFDELSTEIKVLFDRRDPAAVLWPRRAAFESLLDTLNGTDLAGIWGDDETIGWVYQFFNLAEERKKMRDESQAPRNSRELAVRNQFFTPRYVVQFLVDNTLGRTWLQMHGSDSRLGSQCKYFVRPVDEPLSRRQRKDPRDLNILDPACGSGHFLLYAFDLLLPIYEEAWALGNQMPPSHLTGRTLRDDYPEFQRLRQAAPTLIVEHNLYGVDIDARCAQIAALALWLRAQRAFKDLGLPASDRPRVSRTHIVIAEPMPGNIELASAFADELPLPFQQALFSRMVEEMRLAGNLGPLHQAERRLAGDITKARRQFVTEQGMLFPEVRPKFEQGSLDLSGVSDDSVFEAAEDAILAALRRFAESAGGADARRRLFAGDAAQGMALIDLVRNRFDVVLMNPPFGAASLAAKEEFEAAYPRTKNDIYAAFVERGIQFLHPGGMLGAITSRTGFFLSSFQKWREEIILGDAPPVVFADLGYGVMDAAMVEAAAYCLMKTAGPRMTLFLRVLDADDKASALLEALSPIVPSWRSPNAYVVDPVTFRSVPGSPFAYWISSRLGELFTGLPLFRDTPGHTARVGLQTSDNLRFVRAWWETPAEESSIRWFPYAKGESIGAYYGDIRLNVGYSRGDQVGLSMIGRYGRGADHYFRPGLTWAKRAPAYAPRVLPSGTIFSDRGQSAFANRAELGGLLGLMGSAIVDFLFKVSLGRFGYPEFLVGPFTGLPVPDLTPADEAALASLAHRAWSLKRSLDTRTETSHAFVLPALLQVRGATLAARAAAWAARVRATEDELAAIQAEIDERCFELYRIDEEDRRSITEGFGGSSSGTEAAEGEAGEDADADDDQEADTVDIGTLADELVAWAVGVAFGRFDVRLATGARDLPGEPEPFDALPVCSPAMLTGADGLPLDAPPAGYPLPFPDDGILVDDPGHPRDLTTAVRAVFEVVFGTEADAVWREAGALLDPRDHDVSSWLRAGFFDHHLRRHSKSRRKAPVVWRLGVPSGRYSIWVYAHRLSRDSLFAVQNDIAAPRLAVEERRLASLRTQAGPSPSARERAEIDAAEAAVEETRTFLAELRRVAPLWNPDLDDGIVLVSAPLWRLLPGHKPWQKELRSRWDELAVGKYDWTHLAMHLWPERVAPKCATDRSLAIAHDLEEIFWVEGADGKWVKRGRPTRPVEDLVAERISPAVKAALADLHRAPALAAGGRGRGRNS